MSDAGIEGIVPIKPGLDFVDAFSVVQNDFIMRLIRENLEGSGLPGFPDASGRNDENDFEACSLEGGYVIISEDEVLLTPECCTDFSTLDELRQALIERPGFDLLWIGHPAAEVRFVDDLVFVKRGVENCGDLQTHLAMEEEAPEFAVNVNELSHAVDRAVLAREQFSQALLNRVKQVVADPEMAAEVTAQLMAAA